MSFNLCLSVVKLLFLFGGGFGPFERGQERQQGVGVDRLDQVVVEAGLAGTAPGFILGVAGYGGQKRDPAPRSWSWRSRRANS